MPHLPRLFADLLCWYFFYGLQQRGSTRNNMRFSSHVLGMRYAFVPQNNCPLFFMWNFPLGGIYASDFLCGISHVISRAQSVWNVWLYSKHSGQCDRHWFILSYAWAVGMLSFWKLRLFLGLLPGYGTVIRSHLFVMAVFNFKSLWKLCERVWLREKKKHWIRVYERDYFWLKLFSVEGKGSLDCMYSQLMNALSR